MTDIIKKTDDLLKNVAPPRHTLFQLQFFIIGKEPTLQAKMHRCLEELKSRRNMVQAALLEIEETNDVNALHEITIREYGDVQSSEDRKEILIRQIKRKIQANNAHIMELSVKIDAWEEEMEFLIKCYEGLSKQEPIKSWDNYEVQKEYWNEKVFQEIKQRILLRSPVDIEQVRLALSLPDDSSVKIQLLEILNEREQELKSLSNQ